MGSFFLACSLTTTNGSRYLSYINYPDSLYISCGVQQPAIYLTKVADVSPSPPNYPYFRLGADTSTCSGVAIEPPIQAETISLYPNPVQDYLYLSATPLLYGASLNLYDLYGREIKRLAVEKEKVFVGDISEGIYFYTLEQGEKVIQKGKLVKIGF